MSKIESLFGKFGSNEEREQYMLAQLQVITNLTKTNEEMKKNIIHLEKLLKDATKIPLVITDSIISNEELIAREQIQILKNDSLERALTLEETRKLDTYVKIILSLQENNKKPMSSVSGLDAKALLKLVETDGN
jgi:hypothetical protein